MVSRWNRLRFAPAWTVGCALLIAVVGGINLAQTARRVPPAPRYAPRVHADATMRNEQRFARVRAALNAHHVRGTIGYLADLPPEKFREDAAAMREYFLTQFALVPLVLDADADHFTWAVANLHTSSAAQRVPPEFRVIEDFGNGVLLLGKENP